MNNEPTGYTHVFEATELDARAAIVRIVQALRDRGLAEDQVGGAEIVLAEVINNIVEHAYEGLDPGEVNVEARIDDAELHLRITDRGHPLPDGELPEGRPADVDGPLDDLPEGGFGWFMIRTLTRDIRYERANDMNRLSMVFDLIPPAL